MRKVLIILGQLDDVDVEWLARHGEVVRVAAGTPLIEEGHVADAVYFVLDGMVGATSRASGQRVLARLAAGEIVGEMSFVDQGPPSATVTALVDSKLLKVPRDALSQKLARDSAFAARFYKAIAIFLSDRLRAASAGSSRDAGALAEDELDPEVLQNVSMAGDRFDRLLRRLSGS